MHDSLTAVTRQKKALGEELETSRQEMDRLSSLLAKLGKEKEELARSKAEITVALGAFEAENRQQAEIIAGAYVWEYMSSSLLMLMELMEVS